MSKFYPLEEEIKIDFIDNQQAKEQKLKIFLRSPSNVTTEFLLDQKIKSVIEFKKEVFSTKEAK